MKKIVLWNLSPDIRDLIDHRAKCEKTDRAGAVIEILRDAAIERAIEHDVALLESWFKDEPGDYEQPCCHCGP